MRINIDLAKSTNYIPMGFWVKPVAGDPKKPFYRITDLGIPMVKVEDGSALGYSVYVLNVDVSDDVVPSASNPQWRLIESAELIYIQQAFIERLWTQMLIAEGAEIGGFEIGNGFLRSTAENGDGDPMIKLDGTGGSGHLAGKNIKWNSDGDLTLNAGLASPFESFTSTPDIRYSNNYYIEGSGGWTTAFSIPFTIDQNGRTLHIYAKTGSARADAPSGKYFFENGLQKSILFIEAGSIVELLGYCVADTFYGWIVLNRKYVDDYSGNYGEPLNIIAAGKVVGSRSGASIKFRVFNGGSMTVSRKGVGVYDVRFSSVGFNSANDYYVMLTGVTTDSTNYRMKATVKYQDISYFTVEVSDDATANDGSFYFQVFSALDFVY